MSFIDLHCDTLYKMYYTGISDITSNDCHINLDKLKKGGSLVQCMALFDNRDKTGYDLSQFSIFEQAALKLLENENIKAVKSYSDIVANSDGSKQLVMLTKEDMGSMRSLQDIKDEYDKGFRIMGLTWNYENCMGYGNYAQEVTDGNVKRYPAVEKGLKAFGKESVEYLNELGVIIDVSHLSDAGFYDVAKLSKAPFVATHSNARSVCDNLRNLTDDMIRKISTSGGVCGLNFYSFFLDGSEISKIEALCKHIKHIYNVGGEDVLALGTDFDGIECELEIEDFSQMEKLIVFCKKAGLTARQTDKLSNRNALRVFKNVLN